MDSARSVTLAAIAATLIIAGATPAFAGDGDPLVVTSTGLTDGQVVGANSRFHPAWTEGATITKIEVYGDGTLSYTTVNWSSGLRAPLTGVTDGAEVLVTVRAYDATGTWAQASTHVVVDETPPTATFTPAGGALPPVGGTITVTASDVSDDVADIALVTSAGVEAAATTSAPWTITYDSVGGPSYLYLRVTDHAGNIRRYDGFHIDNAPPVIGSLNFFGGPTGRVRGWTQIDVGFSGGVNSYELRVDGALAGSYNGGSTHDSYGTTTGGLLTYDFGTQPRTATLDVLVRDVAGNEAKKSFNLVVDTAGPTISSITPANGTLIRGRLITSTIHATDPAGISDALLNGSWVSDPNHLMLSVPAGADGRKTLSWRVHDNLYNESAITRSVIVDNTRPTLKITEAPKNGAKVKGTVKVNAAATDRNGVRRVELLINGKVVARDLTSGYQFAINTKKYGKKVRVQLRAYDRAGNVTTTATRTWHR